MADTVNKNILSRLDLTDRSILQQFHDELSDIILQEDVERAYIFSLGLQGQLSYAENLQQTNEALYDEYQKMVIRAQWIALPMLPQLIVQSLFREHLIEALEMEDFGILAKIRARLIVEIEMTQRDEFKKKLLKELQSNSEVITKDVIRDMQEKYRPSVSRWIEEYNRDVGVENINDRLKEAQFFSSNPNVKKLTSEEQRRLLIVLSIYQRLSLSSLSKQGIEEAIPIDDPKRPGVLRGGYLEEIHPGVGLKEIQQAEEIEKQVEQQFHEKEPATIAEQRSRHIAQMLNINMHIDDVVAAAHARIDEIEKRLVDAFQKHDANMAIAGLYIIAAQGRFRQLLSSYPVLRDMAKIFLIKKYSNPAVGIFAENHPQDPTVLQGFLQYALEDYFALPTYESVLIALDIGDSAGEPYTQFGYPDAQKHSYVWSPVRVVGDQLKLEQPPTAAIEREIKEIEPQDLTSLLDYAKNRMKAMFTAERVLQGRVGNERVELKKQLVNALRTKDVDKAVGALLVLAKLQDLQLSLKEGVNWRQTVQQYVAEKYHDTSLQQFVQTNATNPTVISEFLQFLLQDRLGLKESDAAMIGMELGDRMGEEYRTMAYADEGQGEFRWVKNKVGKGKLVQEL